MTAVAALCILLCCGAYAAAQPTTLSLQDQWHQYKVTHGKTYNRQEEGLRQQIFFNNLRKIEEHNKLFEEGKATSKLGINQFADLSEDEYKREVVGSVIRSPSSKSVYTAPAGEVLPESVDWRAKGAVTRVKYNALCYSAWAFAVTGAIEGHTFIKTGELDELSEQQLVDCDTGNHGCSGGTIEEAYKYVIENGGIAYEDYYPYLAKDGECVFKKGYVGATISNFTDIAANSEDDLKSAVANFGPVSTYINADGQKFAFYHSGVHYDEFCDVAHPTQAVLIVGYGTSEEGDYWIVKNCWGENWGDKGYIKMARNRNNNCGIASRASFPIV